MSINNIGSSPISNNSNIINNTIQSTSIPVITPWVRNPSWPACTANSGDNKIVGLYAVFPGDGSGNGGNFFAFTGAGDYTINYGDGTTTNYNSGATAYYEFNYNDPDLANTDAPVTFTDSGDLVNRNNHGYTNGMMVRFFNIVTTTGITEADRYYVINATTNTFQIASTSDGSPISLTNDGSATLLPYKIAIITITPQAGQQLTTANFFVKHNQSNLANGYSTGWLDISMACPNLSSFTFSSSAQTILHSNLENFTINEISAISLASLMTGCVSLRKFTLNTTTSVTNCSRMFYSCYVLTDLDFSSTSTANVTDMNNMFFDCRTIQYFPLINTSSVTNMSNMFYSCPAFRGLANIDTSSATNMNNMFYACGSLISIPMLNTSKVTNMNGMFTYCRFLETVPLLDTSSVTDMTNMFFTCTKLKTIPLFNTKNVTNMTSMFQGCGALENVPLLDTSKVLNMTSMFNSCFRLPSVPLFDTSSVTNMTSMFSSCYTLKTIPLFNTANVTNMSSMFNGCGSLESVPLLNTASVTTMASMFGGNCTNLKTVPLFNTANVTNMSSMFSVCSNLIDVPAFNTAKVTNTSTMFGTCYQLNSIPTFDTSMVTTANSMFTNCVKLTKIPNLNFTSVNSSASFSSMFNNCPSLTRILANNFKFTFTVGNCKLSKAALDELFTKLFRVTTTQTLTITGNYGADTAISKANCGTTASSTTVTLADTSSLVVGQRVLGTNVTTSVAVTFQDTGDTVTRNGHGLSNNTIVYFSAITSTTGIAIFTGYYVVNATTNTFQLSATSGGATLALTTDGSGTMFYPSYITSINPNVSFTMSAAASATGTVTLTARTLDTFPALVKGWAVTG